MVAFDGNGFERWQTDVGQFAQPCQQLNVYGVTGIGVFDPCTSTLYVADAFGRLHALSLATGRERAGWPVQVYEGRTSTVTLPAQSGDILAQSLVARWPRLIVTGTDFESAPVKAVRWVSVNGGVTWTAG